MSPKRLNTAKVSAALSTRVPVSVREGPAATGYTLFDSRSDPSQASESPACESRASDSWPSDSRSCASRDRGSELGGELSCMGTSGDAQDLAALPLPQQPGVEPLVVFGHALRGEAGVELRPAGPTIELFDA